MSVMHTDELPWRVGRKVGHQDGALSVLAPALGVEPQEGQPASASSGSTRVEDRDLVVARTMAERAERRAQERL